MGGFGIDRYITIALITVARFVLSICLLLHHLSVLDGQVESKFSPGKPKSFICEHSGVVFLLCSTAGKQLLFRRRARVEPNSGFTDAS